jgi:hypothetical protein
VRTILGRPGVRRMLLTFQLTSRFRFRECVDRRVALVAQYCLTGACGLPFVTQRLDLPYLVDLTFLPSLVIQSAASTSS